MDPEDLHDSLDTGALTAAPVDPAQVARARKGDTASFEALVEARVAPLARTAMAILGQEDEALDAVADTLVIAWRELASMRDAAAFDAWLTRILVNRCKRGLRQVVPQRRDEAPAGPVAVPDRPDTLERAFDRLTVDERTILVLQHLDARSPTMIAGVLRAREDAVESRLLAARSSLDRAVAWEGRLVPAATGHLDGSDDALAAMLHARAGRLAPAAASTITGRVHGELRAHRPGGLVGILPFGERAGSMSGLAGWGAAIAAAVLVMVVLGGRHIGGTGATPVPSLPPAMSAPAVSAQATSPAMSAPADASPDVSPDTIEQPDPCTSPGETERPSSTGATASAPAGATPAATCDPGG